MRTRYSFLFVALLLGACAATTAIPLNRYGLAVITTEQQYRETVRTDPRKELVELERAIPGIVLDVRYATENNFMKKALYPEARPFARRPAADALAAVQRELAASGLGLKIFDAYRPYSVTEAMWEPIKDPDFVADPAKGSRHNRGCAVDVTIIRLVDGAELPMGTGYDDFTAAAAHEFKELPAEARTNRVLLRGVMERNGFEALPSEWWHYDFAGWREFELMDVGFEKIKR